MISTNITSFASQEPRLAGLGWDTEDTTAKVRVHSLLPFLEHASRQSLGSNFWLGLHQTFDVSSINFKKQTDCKIGWCRGRCAPQLNPPHLAARLKKAARRSSRRCTRACERPFRIRGPPTSHNSFLDCESVAWYMQPMATTAANGTIASRCVLFFSQTAPRSNRKALCVFEIGRRKRG